MSHLEDTVLEIRLGDSADTTAVAQLAALDSSPIPDGPLLLALLDGRAVVALSIPTGAVIADPFTPTADVIALVRQRSERLGGGDARTRRRRPRLRPAFGLLT